MSHFDISRVGLTIAGPQAFQVDAHVYTEQEIVREKLAVQLGPILVYCYSLRAVASLLECWTRAHNYGTDILPASAAVRGAPTGNLLNHIGVVLRINQPPKIDDQVVTGVTAKASPSGHPHVRVRHGQLVIDAYDQAAIRSWAQAWDSANTAAKRLWPHAGPVTTDQAAEQFERDYIARTGALPPPR